MRKHPRLDVDMPCDMELAGNRTVHAQLLNISMGGVGLETSIPLASGERFVLLVGHRYDLLRLPCEVRYVRDVWSKQTVHSQFVSLSTKDSLALQEFMADATGGADATAEPRSLWRRVRALVGSSRAASL